MVFTVVRVTATLTQKGELILGLTYQESNGAHQVTAAALFCLQNQAFTAFKEGLEADNLEGNPFCEWCVDMETSHPQFLYWSKTLKLEILFLQFMRAQDAATVTTFQDYGDITISAQATSGRQASGCRMGLLHS